MSATVKLHEMAAEHVPKYLPGADGSDPLFTFMTIFTIGLVLGLGALYFTLHALPEKMAHTANHTQFQLISILAILALFTHNNMFWIVALAVAALQVPDFLSPIRSIADSLKEMSAREKGEPDA